MPEEMEVGELGSCPFDSIFDLEIERITQPGGGPNQTHPYQEDQDLLLQVAQNHMGSGDVVDPEGETQKMREIVEWSLKVGAHDPVQFLNLMGRLDAGNRGRRGLVDRLHQSVMRSQIVEASRKLRG